MIYIALLRGVTPTGKNRIPSMAELARLVTDAGFQQVRTYIQSGNLLLNTRLSPAETAQALHRAILAGLGADLSIIIKTPDQLFAAAQENPFTGHFDLSRVHLVFTNDPINASAVAAVRREPLDGEEFAVGAECFYLYLPRDAAKKRLNTNYLERRLGITATMRKLSVVTRLAELGREME